MPCIYAMLIYMKTTNALKLRQSLGDLLDSLEQDGEPILVERHQKPTAVLISLRDYQRRFVDRIADEKRKEIIHRITNSNLQLPAGINSLEILHEARK